LAAQKRILRAIHQVWVEMVQCRQIFAFKVSATRPCQPVGPISFQGQPLRMAEGEAEYLWSYEVMSIRPLCWPGQCTPGTVVCSRWKIPVC